MAGPGPQGPPDDDVLGRGLRRLTARGSEQGQGQKPGESGHRRSDYQITPTNLGFHSFITGVAMTSRFRARLAAVGVAVGLFTGSSLAWVAAQQGGARRWRSTPTTSAASVTSAKGPEAGVWVIAETTDLPTKFARIVVTDDRGRYVVPDLPRATLPGLRARIWAGRLAARQPRQPGQQLNLTADVAPDAKAAAQVYPAAWWLTMVKAPAGHGGAEEVHDGR